MATISKPRPGAIPHSTARRGLAAARPRRKRAPARPMPAVVHIVAPGLEVKRAEPLRRETIAAFLTRTGWATLDALHGWQFPKSLPTIVEIDGEPVLRRDWSKRRIKRGEAVRFTSYPLGGGQGSSAKQIIGLVALVAVSAFAVWAGPALAAGLGLTGTAATIAGGLATAAIGIGGSLLVNALTAPKQGATNTPSSTQDQIYSVAAQGNTAKLGQPLPVWYGRLKRFPDFAATPWGEFVGNDQYVNVLLSVTMGSLEYEALYIDDTLLWHAGAGIEPGFDAQIAFYEPGQTITLFPVNVDQSSEVTGQQLPSGSGTSGGQYGPSAGGPSGQSPGAWLGGFVANPAGTSAQSIAVDFVFPSGCFTVDSNSGNIGFSTVGLTAEYAPCDSAGAPLAPYTTLFTIARSYASQSPIRDSVKVDVTPGRYLVRFRRNDAELSGTAGANAVLWAGLRSFLQGANSFPDVSTAAIRIKATQTTQGSYKFAVLGTRKLPVWNGSAFVTQATRNNGWAFLDAVDNSQYGPKISIAKVDFNAVVNFAGGCDTRGDTFDYCFTTAVAVPEAWDKILTAARARHFWLGDTVSVVRDEWRDVPTMLLTDREIVRDSTQVSFQMLGDEDPDAVVVEYIDENTWLPASVQYPPDSGTFTALNAETKRIDGIINRSQAFREAAFYYLQSIYRRETVQIQTEYEGRAITFGSVVRVQSELPEAYGYGGAVVAVAGNTLTLNPAPVWDTGPFYIRLRRPNGTFFGPVLVTEGGDATQAVLDGASLAAAQTAQSTTLAAVLAREDGADDPSFELGTGVSSSKLCVVLNGVPNGDLCTLSLVVDDVRVHATDLGNPPVLPVAQFPANDALPLIVGLNARFGQGTAEPMLSASWFPTADVVYYIADVTYDSGQTWQNVYQASDNQFSAVVSLAALTLRVQAVNSKGVRGPYSTVNVTAPTIQIASQTVALESLIKALRYQVTTLQDQVAATVDQVTQQIAAITSNQDARNWLDKKELRTQLVAQAGDVKAQVATLQQAMVDQQTAFANYQVQVSASINDVNASIQVEATAIATLNGYAAAQYAVTLNSNGYATGFNLVNGGAGKSAFVVVADKFQVQYPGLNGSAPVPVFTIGAINGVASIGISGNLLVDGSITARALNVGNLSAISANLGTVVAGLMESPNGQFVIDLNNERIEIWG
ncbi:host specificity factor TipJ family phage tail protein [Bradyrhizobium sp. SZCCHNR2032]|uniref:host specificity factor TipJ family phage tail protein n=1 Tax=Bradyrhizobium sp. SZCCHNR2032 TaxID=3057384 RepID=UPI0029167072|nr:host specificity factor TipJ family phage tail protein [Bradyrhizobium sp. SZCCHNR2032]